MMKTIMNDNLLPRILIMLPLLLCFISTNSHADLDQNDISAPSKPASMIKMETIFAKAIKLKNPKICSEITWDVLIYDYYQSPARSQKSCHLNYAVKSQNIDYCNKFTSSLENSSDWSQKDLCIYRMAQQQRNPKLCKLMPRLKKKDTIDWLKICIERIKK